MAVATPSGAENPFRTDMELVESSLGSGLEEAWWARKELLERLRCVPRMLAAKNARMGRVLDDGDLEDLAQETLVSIWRKRDQYEGRSSIETWVYTFCYHHLMNRVRGLARRPKTVPLEAAREVGAEESRDYGFVYQALSDLGPPEEDVVRMKHFDQLTFNQIGAALGISPNTAKSRYYQGIEKLRTILATRKELSP